MSRYRIPVSDGFDLTTKLNQGQVWVTYCYKDQDIPARESLDVPVEYIPQLITDLRRAYNAWKISQEQSPADGVVAAILLQSHVAQSPGDFS